MSSDTQNVWKELKKPFFVLAPMEDVTDTVFRQIIIQTGKPDLFFTEFTSCEGLIATKNSSAVSHRLKYMENESPIIAQIWGKDPKAYFEGTKIVEELGFDGVDINMGCPVKKIVKQGCCSALIKNQPLASEIITAVKDGAKSIPVSVKTRIGFSEVVTDEWISFLLEHDLDALTVHGRTSIELSKGDANWDEIGKAVQIRDEMKKETIIVGNGDILSTDQGARMHQEHGVDGIMVGRGALQDPWIFNKAQSFSESSKNERIQLLIEHLLLFDKVWGEEKHYAVMKKYFKIYIRGFNEAADLRMRLFETTCSEEALDLLTKELK